MSELIARALRLYDLPPDTPLALLNRSENETWAAGDLVLRLHRPGYHSRAEIASELAWLAALQDLPDLHCVRPVPGRQGMVSEIDGRRIVAFARIPGQELRPGDDLSRWFAPLGEITARLHLHARGWTPPPGFTRKRWDVETILGPQPHWGHWRQAQGLDAPGAALLARATDALAARLHAYGTGPDVFGLIHADLRLANLMVAGERLTAIDFDDCGFGWWAYDLAAALSFIETDPRLPELIARWLEGYTRAAPLGAGDRAMIPALIFLRRVLLTAWLATRADSDTAQALGGPVYTLGTLELAEAFLTDGLAALRP
ncbi:phosphotransferase enzyme family protein [Rhodobacter calidifons]|uniref:Phosphotransferase n=1 Tax=Rhodobacter calidifons TaxID=2715277 RepID=A0ABX0G4K5_9RHOB|nr:phosphotransferase [Rhodobacter calidifons]NHB75794.1 phosphotransferase [Rhodobacter calidifons]